MPWTASLATPLRHSPSPSPELPPWAPPQAALFPLPPAQTSAAHARHGASRPLANAQAPSQHNGLVLKVGEAVLPGVGAPRVKVADGPPRAAGHPGPPAGHGARAAKAREQRRQNQGGPHRARWDVWTSGLRAGVVSKRARISVSDVALGLPVGSHGRSSGPCRVAAKDGAKKAKGGWLGPIYRPAPPCSQGEASRRREGSTTTPTWKRGSPRREGSTTPKGSFLRAHVA